jgi:integrase
MMILAQYTGLRGVDVINLKLSSIDWRKEEIYVIQSKTGTKLTLPLMPIVGNAISKYILEHRPQTNSEYVFVRHIAPYQKLGNKGATGDIIRKHKRLAGIDTTGQHRGFHAFRRSLGTWLLETETPLEMIAQVFGQVDPDSTKSYLSMDTEKLRLCSLSLEGLPSLEARYV